MLPCPERRGVAVSCLDLKVEGQSWLLDNVDGGVMKKYKLRRLMKNNLKQTLYGFEPFSPHSDGIKIFLAKTLNTRIVCF